MLYAPPVPLPRDLVDRIPVFQEEAPAEASLPYVVVSRTPTVIYIETVTWNETGYPRPSGLGDKAVERHSTQIWLGTPAEPAPHATEAWVEEALRAAIRQAQCDLAVAQIVHDLMQMPWPLTEASEVRTYPPHACGPDGTFTVEWVECALLPSYAVSKFSASPEYLKSKLIETFHQYIASGEWDALKDVCSGKRPPFRAAERPEVPIAPHTHSTCDSCGDCHGCEPETFRWTTTP